MEKKTLKVGGMSCDHCTKAAAGALGGIAGVADIVVNLKEGTVSFSHDPALAPLEAIRAAITGEGYTVL